MSDRKFPLVIKRISFLTIGQIQCATVCCPRSKRPLQLAGGRIQPTKTL